jgi:hypothetical protein
MSIYYYQFSIDSSVPHYFTKNDIGSEFVRTLPCSTLHGRDWSYTSAGSSEEKIRKSAMRLTSLGEEYLYFVTKERFSSGWKNVELKRDCWDDGNWISIAQCIEQLPKTTPKPNSYQLVG